MKIIIPFLLIFSFQYASAQQHHVGIVAGANFSSAAIDNVSADEISGKWGSIVGIKYEYITQGQFSFGLDLIHNQFGHSYATEEPAVDLLLFEERNFDYLSMRLKAGLYRSGARFYTFGKIGVMPSILLDANVYLTIDSEFTEGFNNVFLETSEYTSSFDLAGFIEIGGGYKITNRLSVDVSLMLMHSITSYWDYELLESDMRHRALSLNAGVSWLLYNN